VISDNKVQMGKGRLFHAHEVAAEKYAGKRQKLRNNTRITHISKTIVYFRSGRQTIFSTNIFTALHVMQTRYCYY